jgi:RHS repeat-associated protein
VNPTPTAKPFGFEGGLVEKYAGSIHFGARDYTGWQRRWLTKDRIRFDGSLNFYVYCDNDPINCIDPSGFDATQANAVQDAVNGWLGDRARIPGVSERCNSAQSKVCRSLPW